MTELNLKSTTADKTIDWAKDVFQRLTGATVDEIGQLMADKVRLWRFNNQVKNLSKVREIVEREGISPKQISLKVLFPYLEGVSLENDEELQEMWANLLVNYIDSAKNLRINVLPSILTQLSSEEIKILKFLPRTQSELAASNITTASIEIDPAAFSNLERLGLIKRLDTGVFMGAQGEKSFAVERKKLSKHDYCPSILGNALLEACQR